MKDKIIILLKKHWLTILIILSILPFYFAFGCPIRFFTGVSCMGCGMSRAEEALLHLDFATAFRMHPLIFIMPVAAAVIIFWKKLPENLKNILVALFCIAFAGVYFFRLFSGSDIVYIDLKSGFIYKCIQYIISFIN